MAINSPNVLILDSEDVSVTRVGSWGSVEDAEAVGGSYLQSNIKGDYLQFSFKGSALWIRFKFGSNCGKASISIDGKAYPTIDLYNDLAVFKYVNVAVGLDENVSHMVKIGVDGTKNASSTDYYVNVDAFMYRTTEEALSLQNIEYIDLINVINTINRINEIKIISNIANIDLVKEVSNVGKIANISSIQVIRAIQYSPVKMEILANGGFETGDFSGWYETAGSTIDDTIKYRGNYSAKISPGGWIRQFLPRCYADKMSITWYDRGSVDGDKLRMLITFIDGTTEFADVNVFAGVWDSHSYVPTTHKMVSYITFQALSTNAQPLWVDEISLQAPLLYDIQLAPEYRMADANQFSGTFSPAAAGSTTIIAAVTGKVIRVYDFSLWNSGSADVTVELYFGTSGKRLFKGLLAAKTGVLKTYVRPWESNAGDSLVLALSAAGTCDYCIGAVQA
jgi:hypothetical protein